MSLSLVPCTIREARAFVALHHRHHRPPQGALFAVAVEGLGVVVGVAIVRRWQAAEAAPKQGGGIA